MERREVYYDRYGRPGHRSRHYGRLGEIRDETGKVTGCTGSIEGFVMTIWSRAGSIEELAENLFGIIDLYKKAKFHDIPGAVSALAEKEFFIN